MFKAQLAVVLDGVLHCGIITSRGLADLQGVQLYMHVRLTARQEMARDTSITTRHVAIR